MINYKPAPILEILENQACDLCWKYMIDVHTLKCHGCGRQHALHPLIKGKLCPKMEAEEVMRFKSVRSIKQEETEVVE